MAESTAVNDELTPLMRTTMDPDEFLRCILYDCDNGEGAAGVAGAPADAFSLPAPPVSDEQLSVFGPLGQVFGPEMAVPFRPPLLVATHHAFSQFYGMLVDVSSGNVMDWGVHVLRGPFQVKDKPCQTLREINQRTLRGARSSAIVQLMVLSRTATPGRYTWFPFVVCNPCNLSSYTYRAQPATCSTDGLQTLFDQASDALPLPLTLGRSQMPFYPSNGYVLRREIEALAAMRAEAQQRPSLPASTARPALPALIRTALIGELPAGRDDIDLVPEDDAIAYSDYTMSKLVWTTEFLRRFFKSLPAIFLNMLDFGLPELLYVNAATMSTGGRPALLCTFSKASGMVWVSETAMTNVEHVLLSREKLILSAIRKLQPASDRSKSKAAFEVAKARAAEYKRKIVDFKNGTGRPNSPLAWTSTEELEHTGIPLNAQEREEKSLHMELENARSILQQRAKDEILDDAINGNANPHMDIDAQIEARYNKLLREDPDYQKLKEEMRERGVVDRRGTMRVDQDRAAFARKPRRRTDGKC